MSIAMTHTYNITGMTCSGCVANVKSKLLQVPGVMSADVKLDAPQATITMQQHIPTDALQQAIGTGKYTITDAPMHVASTMTDAVEETAPSYYPIYLIFAYIAGITLLIQFANGSFDLMHWMGHFMAGFFLFFSFFKMLNLSAFVDGYSTYDIVAKKVRVYGYVYPFIELALGIAYLTGFQPLYTSMVTFVVMGISSIGVIQSLLKKVQFQCACLGTIIKLPLSKVTLFEDLLMVAMSLVMILKLAAVI